MEQGMKSQDITILVSLLTTDEYQENNNLKEPPAWNYRGLGELLGISAANVHRSVQRCLEANLLSKDTARVNRRRFIEFLIHSVGILYPVNARGITQGLGTTLANGMFSSSYAIVSGANNYVWAYPEGSATGTSIEPIHPSAVVLSSKNGNAHKFFAALDSIRLEKPREKQLAAEYLREIYGKS